MRLTLCIVCGILPFLTRAQGPREPQMRKHTATSTRPVKPVEADQKAPGSPEVQIATKGSTRVIDANAIPGHLVGRFPNPGNPNRIREQAYHFQVPLQPRPAASLSSLYKAGSGGPPNIPFGIALNGVLFEPATAEFWMGDRNADWNYEALGGAVPLGIDDNMAHVQPNGSYHYHGLPTAYLKERGVTPDRHSPLVGWAADGFPIYALYGYRDPKNPALGVVEMKSGYRLKKTVRPGPPNGPGGQPDGTFFRDYEYAPGPDGGRTPETLDEANGRFTITPEFPEGTYAYFLTRDWPVIPRMFRGTPVTLRSEQGPPGQNPPGRGMPPPPPPGRFGRPGLR